MWPVFILCVLYTVRVDSAVEIVSCLRKEALLFLFCFGFSCFIFGRFFFFFFNLFMSALCILLHMVINKRCIMPDTLNSTLSRVGLWRCVNRATFFPNVFSIHNMSWLCSSVLIFVVIYISPKWHINPQI